MIGLPSETRVWLASGATDMRRGFDGLAVLVQEVLKRDPHCGHLFVFRGKRGGLIKVLWHDGQGMCLLAKRLDRGRFVWPRTEGEAVTITRGAARLSAGRHRLAVAAATVAATGGGVMRHGDTAIGSRCSCIARLPTMAR